MLLGGGQALVEAVIRLQGEEVMPCGKASQLYVVEAMMRLRERRCDAMWRNESVIRSGTKRRCLVEMEACFT